MIDFHVHLGNYYFPRTHRKPLHVEQLISFMDANGISKSVLLPLDSPEASGTSFTTFDALAACEQYPDRLIAFCCVDPRRVYLEQSICEYVRMGCVGFGEHKVGLPVDDLRSLKIYSLCGKLGLPVLIHMDYVCNTDKPGLPGLERLAKMMPSTTFILHGQAWWAEISAFNDGRSVYPTGHIQLGRVEILLQTYPNLYADISAGSGYNALTRDRIYTPGFLTRNCNKLLFGTDYLYPSQELPIIDFIKTLPIDEQHRSAIIQGNAERLLRL